MMKLLDHFLCRWREFHQARVMRERYRRFLANPAANTASPWIRAMINSPVWEDTSDLRPGPRRRNISQPRRVTGRVFVQDMLDLERIIRFRGYRWSWRGIFSAWGDDALVASYPAEHDRLLRDLRTACPDEMIPVAKQEGA